MEPKEVLESKLRVYEANLRIINEKKNFKYNDLFTLHAFSQQGFHCYDDEIQLPDDSKFIGDFIQSVKDYYSANIHNIKLELENL